MSALSAQMQGRLRLVAACVKIGGILRPQSAQRLFQIASLRMADRLSDCHLSRDRLFVVFSIST
ncbi:MAG: hypothetical protein AAF268_13285 [Cyanobacteria bacterium P01_A01_bin.3]